VPKTHLAEKTSARGGLLPQPTARDRKAARGARVERRPPWPRSTSRATPDPIAIGEDAEPLLRFPRRANERTQRERCPPVPEREVKETRHFRLRTSAKPQVDKGVSRGPQTSTIECRMPPNMQPKRRQAPSGRTSRISKRPLCESGIRRVLPLSLNSRLALYLHPRAFSESKERLN
jgi:hypothetical protein